MNKIKPGTVLEDIYQEKRWEIGCFIGAPKNMQLYEVIDLKNEMKKRKLKFATPNYPQVRNSKTEFIINDLNLSFQAMIRVLCNNFSFLPEAVEELNYFNPQTSDKQLGFVYSDYRGIWREYDFSYEKNLNNQVHRDILDLCFKIQNLHLKDYYIQSIPRFSLRRNSINYKLFWRFLPTAISKFARKNIEIKNSANFPNKFYGAPESFTGSRYELSPATDVYALGKFVLQMLLGIRKYNEAFYANPFPTDVTGILNQTVLNNDKLRRFVAVALQPNPVDRFQNMHQVINYLDPSSNKEIGDKALIIVDLFKKDKSQKYNLKKIGKIIDANSLFQAKQFITKQRVSLDNSFFNLLKKKGFEVIEFEKTDKFSNKILNKLNTNKLIVVGDLKNYFTSYLLEKSQAGRKIFISNENKIPSSNDIETYDLNDYTFSI